MYKRIYFPFFLLFTLLGTLSYPALLQAGNVQTTSAPVPQAIVKCLPKTREQTTVLARAVENDTDYYLVHTSFKRGEDSAWGDFLIAAESTGCVLLHSPDAAQTLYQKSLAQYVPMSVAQKLALSKWQKELDRAGSKEALRQEILAGIEPGPDTMYLFPEDIWALRQLGIEIPSNKI